MSEFDNAPIYSFNFCEKIEKKENNIHKESF